MRRKDREITDFNEIRKIIDACEILRLGLADGDFPYIVPVNFAYTVTDGQICFYIHGAVAGRKYELLCRNPVCSFEMDIPLYMECLPDKKGCHYALQIRYGTSKRHLFGGGRKRSRR